MPEGWEQNSCAPGPFFKENKCSFIFHLCPFNRRAVSIVGAIGFIGLIGPHIAKPIVGEDARKSPIISKSIKEFRLGSFSFINRLNIVYYLLVQQTGQQFIAVSSGVLD